MTENLGIAEVKQLNLTYRARPYTIEYFHRRGCGPTVLLLHGLGGAKENYWEATKARFLAGYNLLSLDNPGSGNSTYYEDDPLNVDDLCAITASFVRVLELQEFTLVGASMGGLTSLLYLRGEGAERANGFFNIEGNLMPEDCMFSSRVVKYEYHEFQRAFPGEIERMKKHGNAGYRIVANNLELNTNLRSYFEYSFQTVRDSQDGSLLAQFVALELPKVLVYGAANAGLSYLPELRERGVNTECIPDSDHFIFYDHPKALYERLARFVSALR